MSCVPITLSKEDTVAGREVLRLNFLYDSLGLLCFTFAEVSIPLGLSEAGVGNRLFLLLVVPHVPGI